MVTVKKIIGKFRRLLAPPPPVTSVKAIEQIEYDNWVSRNILNAPPSSYYQYFSSTFLYGTKYGNIVHEGMMEAETMFAGDLLKEINDLNIPGAIVEFGVFQGEWLERLDAACGVTGLNRIIYGFDSFEGLPAVDRKDDYDCWEKGQYAANIEDVALRLKCSEKPHIKLIKGWFSDTFQLPGIQSIQQIAYARIDGDLYSSAVECLNFIQNRLVDKAILVFDDCGPNIKKGEAKAFYEWLPLCGMYFEFLALNSVGHLYLRVHR
jgi:hypothetical protein